MVTTVDDIPLDLTFDPSWMNTVGDMDWVSAIFYATLNLTEN